MPLIEVEQLCKHYTLGGSRVEALRGVSFRIDRGEFLALVGPSGSGKSTLMNTLGCLDRPTSGSYRLDGRDIAAAGADERAGLRNTHLGFVFQNFNLLPRTTALENVELPLVYAPGVTARERRRRATAALTEVGLADRLDHHPAQLSGGQQQRVAIARALVNEPSILMGDEPTGNLDSRTGADVIALLRKLNVDRSLTVVLVTHDQQVARHADRTIVLRDGLIVADTTDFAEAKAALEAPMATAGHTAPGDHRPDG
jgi:putative ABC transport system ATP-binding protein